MAWEENSRICLHMQLIAILSRIGVFLIPNSGFNMYCTFTHFRDVFLKQIIKIRICHKCITRQKRF